MKRKEKQGWYIFFPRNWEEKRGGDFGREYGEFGGLGNEEKVSRTDPLLGGVCVESVNLIVGIV